MEKKSPETFLSVREHVSRIVSSYDKESETNFIDERKLPDSLAVKTILDNLLEILFPGCSGKREITTENLEFVIGDLLTAVKSDLESQVLMAYKHHCLIPVCNDTTCEHKTKRVIEKLFFSIPDIRKTLKKDVQAAFAGDPAAVSEEEIVVSYPGLKALAIHRISHILYESGVPLIPRMMNEIAHSQTGIDIHPGATIGEGFFIDHGTGVVIGETTIIGNNVKIYQGVTLGALSFPRDTKGQLIRCQKRHPTIEDNVTIYAHATILGNITIGKGSLIGGNVWLKESVDEKTLVIPEEQKMKYHNVSKKD